MGNDLSNALGDYDLRSLDVGTLYAGYVRHAIPEAHMWVLSMAESTMPENHIGSKAWLTAVSGTEIHIKAIQDWAEGLAGQIAQAKFRDPKIGKRFATYVKSYDHSWGVYAARDGMALAIAGPRLVPGLQARREQLGAHVDAYRRIRNFVAGAITLQMDQYENAVRWAMRMNRSVN